MSIQNVGFVVRRDGKVVNVKTVSAANIIRIGSARMMELRLESDHIYPGHAIIATEEDMRAVLASSIVASPVTVNGEPVKSCDIFDRGKFEIDVYSIQVFFDPKEGDMPNVDVTN